MTLHGCQFSRISSVFSILRYFVPFQPLVSKEASGGSADPPPLPRPKPQPPRAVATHSDSSDSSSDSPEDQPLPKPAARVQAPRQVPAQPVPQSAVDHPLKRPAHYKSSPPLKHRKPAEPLDSPIASQRALPGTEAANPYSSSVVCKADQVWEKFQALVQSQGFPLESILGCSMEDLDGILAQFKLGPLEKAAVRTKVVEAKQSK